MISMPHGGKSFVLTYLGEGKWLTFLVSCIEMRLLRRYSPVPHRRTKTPPHSCSFRVLVGACPWLVVPNVDAGKASAALLGPMPHFATVG